MNLINRQPLNEISTEATYELIVVAVGREFGRVREAVLDDLDKHRYAVSVSEAQEQPEDLVEIRITLAASTAVPQELDSIVNRVLARSDVRHASWAMRTGD